jgi:hypothetical protein
MDKDTTAVNHPKHYNAHPSGIECIEVVRHENFNIGNAMKYIWRHKNKGKPVEDLEKAIFYLKDEIKRIKSETFELKNET